MMLCTALSPNPLIPASPNRTSPVWLTENFRKLSLTSGPLQTIPMALVSAKNLERSAILPKARLITAAIYWDGKLAFR